MSIFAVIGVLLLLRYGYGVLYFIYRHTVRAPKRLTNYGSWAVVTGATDGIGKSYAKELARKGLNVLLISRSAEKLAETKREIEAALKGKDTKVSVMVIDFSTISKSGNSTNTYDHIQKELKGIDVGVLVNNVGVSYEHCEYFHDVPDNTIDNLIKINIEVTTYMTKLILPAMISKGKGAIINISSMSGVSPAPLLSAYGATKSYVDSFSRMLALEYQSKGIFVQSLTPAFVVSKMSGFRRSSLSIPSSDVFVKSAIRTIGYEYSTAGFWVHDIMRVFTNIIPEWLVGPKILASHLGLRKRYLARKAK